MKIPEELIGKEIDLKGIGINNIAWLKNDALLLLDYFEKESILVLGGDVLVKENEIYKHTYDNWYYEKENGKLSDSIINTRVYIKNYKEGDFAFVLVTKQNT